MKEGGAGIKNCLPFCLFLVKPGNKSVIVFTKSKNWNCKTACKRKYGFTAWSKYYQLNAKQNWLKEAYENPLILTKCKPVSIVIYFSKEDGSTYTFWWTT